MTPVLTPTPLRATASAQPRSAGRPAAAAVAVLLGALVVFQVLLALGAPLGRAAWGGEHTTLPTSLRIATVVPIALYVLGAAVVLRRAGHRVPAISAGFARPAAWVFAVVLIGSALANVASQSNWERFLMAPVALLLGLLTVVVARSPRADGRSR